MIKPTDGRLSGDIIISGKMRNLSGEGRKMRIVKEAEERKNEILDAAERLFGAKGYDGTSTGDILDVVGIARGTLYYHFKSKEEMLDAMIDRMMGQMTAQAKALAMQTEIPILQRFTMVITALNIEGDLGAEIMEQIHKPQNALMHRKIQERLLSDVTPVIAGLIEEGIRLGICQTDYPTETAEMTLLYANTVFDDLAKYSGEERRKKIAAFIYNLERLLQMEQGSMLEVVLPLFQ